MGVGHMAGEHGAMENHDISVAAESSPTGRRLDCVIEANGSEYLVMINGSVFLALSLGEAEALARRMCRSPTPRERPA